MIALHFFSRLYLGLVYLFVIGPMLIIIIDSLNSATSFPSPFETVTLRWYVAVLRHDEFLTAMRVSAIVAALAATIATVLGFLAAYALVRYPLRGENAIATFLLAPILVPQIVIGLAMLQLLALLGVQLTLAGLVAVHTIYVMPFTLRLVMTGLARFDFGLEEAALSLGAGRLRAVRYVTLPLVRTALIAGFVFAFILSFVNRDSAHSHVRLYGIPYRPIGRGRRLDGGCRRRRNYRDRRAGFSPAAAGLRGSGSHAVP